ncbi:PEPxxWA-CTERM sorting domain-containing protein [Sphingomonas sp. CFBP 8760]|uniref:PEPxxWA-CTERM sorting domain-containing protein n=1 Tax=Sphingomonas sp. CFBP 8760 TaxID=2775282 RepID=UPI001FCED170|nr:PEPxxWA-CTERM sorting domain-containing protein [Sphingomonas sp. CFBP 8760]
MKTISIRRFATMAGMACAAFIAASPAAAVVMVATYRGTVAAGVDTAGLFGGGSLAGKAYEAMYTYNTDDFSGDIDGSSYETKHVVTGRYSLTIDGTTVGDVSQLTIRLGDERPARNGAPITHDLVGHGTQVVPGDTGSRLSLFVIDELDFVDGLSPTQTIEYRRDFRFFENGGTFTYADGSEIFLDATRVDIIPAAIAAVPEPASWALMLAGFTMVGTAMRVRRRRVAFA